jgi:hypothetical protein
MRRKKDSEEVPPTRKQAQDRTPARMRSESEGHIM